ncbi:hypothetical protein EVG20_g5551 [Dentipellis fragilis]|uniref:Uncharacterized protein n=1 Tax=Dentipellis fragilis TaxID=205917 RepID=A0A4Y9YSZ1_9AGAM|nr:hypothetical protein EVG20_g5551 [Dentipellis fragilis]
MGSSSKWSASSFADEVILHPNYSSLAEIETAPKPLSPNFGYGNSMSFMEDMSMFLATNSGERTLDEFIQLGADAGLRFVKLWHFAETGLVEFVTHKLRTSGSGKIISSSNAPLRCYKSKYEGFAEVSGRIVVSKNLHNGPTDPQYVVSPSWSFMNGVYKHPTSPFLTLYALLLRSLKPALALTSPSSRTMSQAKVDLESLLALINSATRGAIQEYESAGCELPALDNLTPFPEHASGLQKALRTLEGACFQLCKTLSRPEPLMFQRAMAHVDTQCLLVVVNAKIADVIARHPEGLHVDEIAKRTNLEPRILLKVMRNLAAKHLFRETSADVYANNRLSATLLNDSPCNSIIHVMAMHNMHGASNLYDSMADRDYGHSWDVRRSPFSYGIRDDFPDSSFYDWLHTKQFEDVLIVKHPPDFPRKDLPSGTTVCDLGGGIGTMAMDLAKTHHHLRLTLQDLPSVIDHARRVWSEEMPDAIRENRIDFIPVDFLQSSPVKNQDIYYIRQVAHNWPDADCVTILKNIRATPHFEGLLNCRVSTFTDELVLQPNFPTSPVVDTAPKPLSPNFGYGNSASFMDDVSIFMETNAGERTLDEFIQLGTDAGLRFVKLWPFTETGLVEFVL